MITQYYPSKRKPKNRYWPTSIVTAEDKAKKLGITVEVYQQRVKAVAVAGQACSFYVGQKVMPVKKEDREEHGVMTVSCICRSYDLYGDVEWHDPPFILQLESGLQRGKFVNCTANWAERMPKEVTNEC